MEPELILHVDDEQVLRCRTCESSLPSHGVCEWNNDRVRVLPPRWLNHVSSSSSPSSCRSSAGGTDSKERPRRFLPRLYFLIQKTVTIETAHLSAWRDVAITEGWTSPQLQLCHADSCCFFSVCWIRTIWRIVAVVLFLVPANAY